jgi:cell division protein FtsN
MSRQARRHRSSSARSPGAGWGRFVLGIITGVLLTVMVNYFQNTETTLGHGLKNLFDKHADSPNARMVKQEKPRTAPKPNAPKFDFYTILPEIESILPKHSGKLIAPAKQANVRYVLQAASYANFNDADRMRAELALSGLEARIEKVTIENKGDYYRVRLGPFEQLDQLDEADKQLVKLGIRAIRLKITKAER